MWWFYFRYETSSLACRSLQPRQNVKKKSIRTCCCCCWFCYVFASPETIFEYKSPSRTHQWDWRRQYFLFVLSGRKLSDSINVNKENFNSLVGQRRKKKFVSFIRSLMLKHNNEKIIPRNEFFPIAACRKLFSMLSSRLFCSIHKYFRKQHLIFRSLVATLIFIGVLEIPQMKRS